jgi:hypothetical protein
LLKSQCILSSTEEATLLITRRSSHFADVAQGKFIKIADRETECFPGNPRDFFLQNIWMDHGFATKEGCRTEHKSLNVKYAMGVKQREHIRALSPALAVKFNISPGRWQHFPLWPLFLQREKGKRTEMTGTQHVATLKHQFLHYITLKMVLDIFYYQNNYLVFCTSVIW